MPVWTGADNLALTGIRNPDRPARSEWLYPLSYPGQRNNGISVQRYSKLWPRQVWKTRVEGTRVKRMAEDRMGKYMRKLPNGGD